MLQQMQINAKRNILILIRDYYQPSQRENTKAKFCIQSTTNGCKIFID